MNKRADRKTRVFVVDDHPLLRQGIAQLINAESDMETCGEADSAAAALDLIENAKPDLAILDISLKDMSGIDLLKQLKARFPNLKVLMLSMHDESVVVQRALRAGASGYIMKEEASEKALAAIRCVLAGHIYLSTEIAKRLSHGPSDEDHGANAFVPCEQEVRFNGDCYTLYSPINHVFH